jgi:hypothetical protein
LKLNPFIEGEMTMGEAKRRKTLDPSFGETKGQELHPIYHFGIKRAVALLRLIHRQQTSQIVSWKPETWMLTNDIPGHPDEVSMGFTAAQIEELRQWVENHQHLIPQHVLIKVLPMENCIHQGRIWKSKDFPKLLINL